MCGDARNPQLAHTTMPRAHAPMGYSSASGVGNIEGLPSNPKKKYGKGMPKFKRGDKVRIRPDCASPYRGRMGAVEEEPSKDSSGFWYMVKFELKGLRVVNRFFEEDLEVVND